MVKSEIYIRRATVLDAALLAELSAVTFFDTFKDTCSKEDMDSFLEEYFNVKEVESELENPNDYYFIAFINNTAAGYLRLKEEKSEVEFIASRKAIELKRIYVLTGFLSKKIGATLMNFALDFAAEKRYELIWLGVWEHNERAKKFYQRFEFKNTGVKHPFPIGNTPQTDEWLYRLIRK